MAGQVIEYESNGLRYQALTKSGLTIMVAQLPSHLREYSILQVAVSNGSPVAWTVKPEDFRFESAAGGAVKAAPARAVVDLMLQKGSHSDVVRLISAYEAGLYGLQRYKATNGYEQRRLSAVGELTSTRVKAATTASAIAFVATKLGPGQSTDGALFLPNAGKPLGPGKLIVNAAGEVFEFDAYTSTP